MTTPLAAPLRAALRARLATGRRPAGAAVRWTCSATAGWCSPRPAPWPGRPWSLLPGLVGRPLTIPPSATRWLELRGRSHSGRERVGLVAGPDVARGQEEVTRAAAGLAATRGCCAATDATAARVAALAAEVDVLHLAGHGRHTGENPLFSAVELVDGPWFGYDIDELPAYARRRWCSRRASSAGSRCAPARRPSG